ATEAAAVGALAAIAIARFAYRALSLRDLLTAAHESARTTTMLFLILGGAAMFGHVISVLGLPRDLLALVVGQEVGALGFLLAVMALVFLLGMFLETISI